MNERRKWISMDVDGRIRRARWLDRARLRAASHDDAFSRLKIYRDGGDLVIAGMIKAWSSDEAATSAEPSLYLMSPRQRESASNRYRIKHANSPV